MLFYLIAMDGFAFTTVFRFCRYRHCILPVYNMQSKTIKNNPPRCKYNSLKLFPYYFGRLIILSLYLLFSQLCDMRNDIK